MKDALLSLWRILVNLAFSLFSCSSFTTLDWTPPILQHPYFELFITSCTLTHTSIWPLHSLNISTTHSHYLFNRQIARLCLVPFFCSYQLLLLTVGVAPWWRDTKIRVLETETFPFQLLQGQCFLLNLEGPCKLSFVRSISSVMTGYTRAFLSCRPLWFTGLVVLT